LGKEFLFSSRAGIAGCTRIAWHTRRKTSANQEPVMNTPMAERTSELMAFEAPYLEAKLLRLGLVETREEAASLFQEVKKYLLLAEHYSPRTLPMFSVRVDEIWHQFVLFTAEYAEFCARFAGRFLHHAPSEADAETAREQVVSFAEFRAEYAARFGELSSHWSDELSLKPATRLAQAVHALPLRVETEENHARLVHAGSREQLVCRTPKRCADALRFIASERCFLVRELPGLRVDRERIELCRPLVKFGILRLAP
jgi:hypothetical protein